jgi:hypothetical protein
LLEDAARIGVRPPPPRFILFRLFCWHNGAADVRGPSAPSTAAASLAHFVCLPPTPPHPTAALGLQTDDAFFSQLERAHGGHSSHYIVAKDIPSAQRDPSCKRQFGVRHYAGEVRAPSSPTPPPPFPPVPPLRTGVPTTRRCGGGGHHPAACRPAPRGLVYPGASVPWLMPVCGACGDGYFYQVAYSVVDFVSKNKDDIHTNLQDLVGSSTNEFVTERLFFRAASVDASGRRGAAKPISQVCCVCALHGASRACPRFANVAQALSCPGRCAPLGCERDLHTPPPLTSLSLPLVRFRWVVALLTARADVKVQTTAGPADGPAARQPAALCALH